MSPPSRWAAGARAPAASSSPSSWPWPRTCGGGWAARRTSNFPRTLSWRSRNGDASSSLADPGGAGVLRGLDGLRVHLSVLEGREMEPVDALAHGDRSRAALRQLRRAHRRVLADPGEPLLHAHQLVLRGPVLSIARRRPRLLRDRARA